MNYTAIHTLNDESLQDCINLASGLFHPLDGFMNAESYRSVVDSMLLPSGQVWTIPITLDVSIDTFDAVQIGQPMSLVHNGRGIGSIQVESLFEVVPGNDNEKVYGTSDIAHPGVAKETERNPYRIGGKIELSEKSLLEGNLIPSATRAYFKAKGWKTIAGFQTRNPLHKAHEYLQRVALEVCDGLFINPLIGWKKVGDFSEAAVTKGYRAMIDTYYSGLNVHFDSLKTPMRYAGPREAIFHATIRRNLGCTHFIIGRDHAGVGNYYGKYEAHQLARKLVAKHDLGIELLLFNGPFYCRKCEQIVTEKTCQHSSEFTQDISGTEIRSMLSQGKRPNETYMRNEVADEIIKLGDNMFIKT